MGRKLKCILLSESSQAEEKTYCVIPITGHWKRRNHGDIKNISDARDEGWRDEQGGHRGNKQCYNDTYMSLYLFSNPKYVQ